MTAPLTPPDAMSDQQVVRETMRVTQQVMSPARARDFLEAKRLLEEEEGGDPSGESVSSGTKLAPKLPGRVR